MSPHNEISVFAKQPPATPDCVAETMAILSIAFPQMPPLFWEVATKEVIAERMSAGRLAYIKQHLLHYYQYPTLTLANILGIDKTIKVLNLNEYYIKFGTTDLVNGWCKLKEKNNGCTQFCKIADANAAGLEILTN